MDTENNHLLWKVTHADAPGKVSYLFGTLDNISPTQQREITRRICSRKEFKKSSVVVTDRNYNIGDGAHKKEDLLHCTSVAKGIGIRGKLTGKHVYALDNDEYFDNEHSLARTGDITSTKNLLKWGLFTLTAPVSLPYYFIYREHNKHKSREELRDAYINEDLKKIAKRVYDQTGEGTWVHLVKHRNYKWLMKGNFEDPANPTCGGLYKYLKEEQLFIAVPAENLFGYKHGLLSLMRQMGYTLEPIDWQQHDEELHPCHMPHKHTKSHHVRHRSDFVKSQSEPISAPIADDDIEQIAERQVP